MINTAIDWRAMKSAVMALQRRELAQLKPYSPAWWLTLTEPLPAAASRYGFACKPGELCPDCHGQGVRMLREEINDRASLIVFEPCVMCDGWGKL